MHVGLEASRLHSIQDARRSRHAPLANAGPGQRVVPTAGYGGAKIRRRRTYLGPVAYAAADN